MTRLGRERANGASGRRWCFWSGAVLTLIVTAAGPARGQVCGEIPEVLIVLDRSGSMKEIADGQSKWQSARQAVTDLTNQFGGQLALGLMLYPRFPDVHACAPGTLNVPLSTTGQVAISTALNKAAPDGNTPLIATLDSVMDALQTRSQAARHVILISDGKETCLSAKAPLTSSASCSWDNGTNYRKCGGCGWQFCLANGSWSTACQAKPEIFTCPGGQTCGSNAQCSGAVTGSLSLADATQQLTAAGVTTHVVGFGAQVNATALNEIASLGGTGTFHKATNLTQLKAAFQAIASAISCCGNGQLDAGEQCDTALAAGAAGACPTSCDDGDPCTKDSLAGSDCGTTCSHDPITTALDGDGCCPVGATWSTDKDCSSCGNGALDSGETCDPQIPSGSTGACGLVCDDDNACTADQAAGDACNPTCSHTPLSADASAKDGCCPSGSSSTDDPDCLPPCSPGVTQDCVDTCQGVSCNDGERCEYGQCVPWDTGADEAGCDCSVGDGADGTPWALLALLLPLALAARRRRSAPLPALGLDDLHDLDDLDGPTVQDPFPPVEDEDEAPTTIFMPGDDLVPPPRPLPWPVIRPRPRRPLGAKRALQVLGLAVLLGVLGTGSHLAIALSRVQLETRPTPGVEVAPAVEPSFAPDPVTLSGAPEPAAEPQEPVAAETVVPAKKPSAPRTEALASTADTETEAAPARPAIAPPDSAGHRRLVRRLRRGARPARRLAPRRRPARHHGRYHPAGAKLEQLPLRPNVGFLKIQCARHFAPIVDGRVRPLWRSMRPMALAPGRHTVQLLFVDNVSKSKARWITVEEGKTTILFFAPR